MLLAKYLTSDSETCTQENGVSERMNRTIMERARSMRLHARFPLHFWEDVVDIVFFLINKVLVTEVAPGLLAGEEPDAHQFYVMVFL